MTETHGIWHLLLGKLTLDALPTYSKVAAGGASMVVLGILSVVGLITYLRKWRYMWTEWFTSVDHKRIGIMYVVLSMVMLSLTAIFTTGFRFQIQGFHRMVIQYFVI